MHASTEQLLSRRDGEPLAAAVAAHIDSCGQCRDALARVEATQRELRGLPELTAPRDLWPAVAAASARRRRGWRPLAIAATIAAATAITTLLALTFMRGERAPEQAVVVPATAPAVAPAAGDDLVLLADRSADMERELRALRANAPAVVRVGHQLGRERVESRLRALDYGLYRAGGAADDLDLRRAYWNERVRLLDTMLQMERAELINQDLAEYRVRPVRQDR